MWILKAKDSSSRHVTFLVVEIHKIYEYHIEFKNPTLYNNIVNQYLFTRTLFCVLMGIYLFASTIFRDQATSNPHVIISTILQLNNSWFTVTVYYQRSLYIYIYQTDSKWPYFKYISISNFFRKWLFYIKTHFW